MVVSVGLLPSGHARADGLVDWFWSSDQQGRRFYEAHDYTEAAGAFADPNGRATALIRQGKYADAAEILAPIQTSVAQYNRGTALARGRDYQGAVAAFEAALALDPGNTAAAHNLEVTQQIVAYLTETSAGRGPRVAVGAAGRYRHRPDRRGGKACPSRRGLAVVGGRGGGMDALGREQAGGVPQEPVRGRGGAVIRGVVLALLLAPAALAQEGPQVKVALDPEGPVTVGTPVEVTATVLVPSYMPRPPVWPGPTDCGCDHPVAGAGDAARYRADRPGELVGDRANLGDRAAAGGGLRPGWG